jgi:hypothetical protein
MSLTTRLVELERKHKALDTKLAHELSHASKDEAAIAALKRQKLVLKDEITRLRQHRPPASQLH